MGYLFSILFLFLGSVLPVKAQSVAKDTVSFQGLLHEIINRDALARYPDPYYTTRQFSSYDRNSTRPDTSSWFANWDRTQFIRVEHHDDHKEYVMMDTDGPGAIVRFWMTFGGKGAGQGTLRIYFDGDKEPTIQGKAFDILSGGALAGKPLSTSVSPKTRYKFRGHDLYLPLPFGRHCKITYQSKNIKDIGAKTGGESVYYNIEYRDYETGTKVKTFSLKQIDRNKALLRRVQEKLMYRSKDYDLSQRPTKSVSFAQKVAAGDSVSYSIDGTAAIRRIDLQLDARDEKQALRSTILKIKFDGQQTVWSPIGDFFGTGYQYRKSDTWYTTVTECGELKAYWVMPFHKKATITIINLGDQEVNLTKARLTYSDWKWSPSSMHFGASWHQYSDLYTGERKDMEGHGHPFDINYTTLQGRGVYVGDALTLFNTSYAWWGEGDEKIYIDGEDFPSHFGTGSEDYYGYAWVRPEVFTNHPFISEPDGSGNISPGYTINMRYRSLDAIPFQRSLKFDMEMWHWVSTKIDYAPTTFYYLKPGGRSLTDPQPKEAEKKVALRRSDIISPVMKDGRIEGENMIIDSYSGGAISFQYLDKPQLSNKKQLWWRKGNEGDVLKARFVSNKSGTFNAAAQFVVAPDYGTVRILINGKIVLDSFNGYNDKVDIRKVSLGAVQLKKGKNDIRVKIKHKNKVQDKGFFGLDYIDFSQN